MRIAVVSHSLVAERQYWFWNYFATLSVAEVRLFSPRKWGVHSVPWGHYIMNEGDLRTYQFQQDALIALEKFKPDVIYVQNEAYCKVSGQMMYMRKRLGCRFALFVWENVTPYDQIFAGAGFLLEDCDLVVCGSGEAERLVKPYNAKTLKCIQVGVNADAFRIDPSIGKDYDIIFQGRMVPEKGVDLLRKVERDDKSLKALWPQPSFGTPYRDLYQRYNQARMLAAHSVDTPEWKEQHAGYASLEALACGLYVVTSDSSSIVEGLDGCPGVWFSKMGDLESLKNGISYARREENVNAAGREWVIGKYGYRAVATKLMEAFEKLK